MYHNNLNGLGFYKLNTQMNDRLKKCYGITDDALSEMSNADEDKLIAGLNAWWDKTGGCVGQDHSGRYTPGFNPGNPIVNPYAVVQTNNQATAYRPKTLTGTIPTLDEIKSAIATSCPTTDITKINFPEFLKQYALQEALNSGDGTKAMQATVKIFCAQLPQAPAPADTTASTPMNPMLKVVLIGGGICVAALVAIKVAHH